MAKKSKNLIQIEYVAARLAFGLLGLLPRRAAVLVSIWILSVASRLIASLRTTGMMNLAIAFPEKSIDERKRILTGTFENLGRVLGELSQVHKLDRKEMAANIDFELDDESKDVYARNKTEGRGILVTTGHFGNWELLVLSFAALYEPISYLARPLDNPKIDEMLNDRRTRFGNTPINKTNSATIAMRLLKSGGILGILADVNAHPREGVFVPFFGVPACTGKGAAILAIRSNALIYPMFCVWDKQARKYRVVHGRLIEPINTGDRVQDIIDTTELFTAEIENVIRQYPDQWMWIHRRWKTRPPGEPEIY